MWGSFYLPICFFQENSECCFIGEINRYGEETGEETWFSCRIQFGSVKLYTFEINLELKMKINFNSQ